MKSKEQCTCKKGQERDNCPQCEGTGFRIDFAAIRNAKPTKAQKLTIGTDYNEKDHPAICALVDFATQNSGIQFGNYGDVASFRSEQRSIAADLKRFKAALYQASIDRVTDADVIAEAPHAFSGRLQWVGKAYLREKHGIDTDYTPRWSYCTGQYFPTEYRKAAATLLEYAARRVRQGRTPAKRVVVSVSELRALNAENGGCWFEPSTMRFFKTRIESGILGGKYFVSSEEGPSGGRRYSVRSFDEKGSVDTVGEFQEHGSAAAARQAIRELMNPQPAIA